ncbi:MAG: hypothetical protein DME26_18490 [Verrucomicrobia bacterium]|nr:MAG: hypothetical protein DME26_18490 [Verrucomicrobiota bacterium]
MDGPPKVIHFIAFEDLRSVGVALGVSDDTEQKRVSRALEKLREQMSDVGQAALQTTIWAALANLQRLLDLVAFAFWLQYVAVKIVVAVPSTVGDLDGRFFSGRFALPSYP